jgi:hypothetical protein
MLRSANPRCSRKLSTFQLFSIGTFGRFSTTRYMNVTSPIDFASVEQIHNTIHGAVGFGPSFGHMSSVHVAAFDPIFWLHHGRCPSSVPPASSLVTDCPPQPKWIA